MAVKVVDASAVAAVLFAEPGADALASRLGESRLAAPALLPFEVANVCLTKMKHHPKQRDALVAQFHLLAEMGIESIEVDQGEVVGLAERARITAYDASYLWLARALGAELVTLDKRLAAAARAGAR
ncbi:MAG: type II toxin-antitoxin system VapC family toxin [Betaproteobacteria bacterium]|nr:type II toxin-antitoxin system VapC family toxin [Betaproteobacteria bacterium]